MVGQRRLLTSLVGGELRTSAKDRYGWTIATCFLLSVDCLSLSAKTTHYITCEVDYCWAMGRPARRAALSLCSQRLTAP